MGKHKVMVSMKNGCFDKLWLEVGDIEYEIPRIGINSTVTIKDCLSIFEGSILVDGVKDLE